MIRLALSCRQPSSEAWDPTRVWRPGWERWEQLVGLLLPYPWSCPAHPHPTHPAVPFLPPPLTQLFLVSAPIGSFPGKFESQAPFLPRNPLKSCLQGPASSLSSWALRLVTPGSGSSTYYTLHTGWQVRSPPPPPHPPHHHCSLWDRSLHGPDRQSLEDEESSPESSCAWDKDSSKKPPGQLPRLPPSKEPVGPEEKGDPQEPGNKQAPPGGDTLRKGERGLQPAGPGPRVARMKNTHIFF